MVIVRSPFEIACGQLADLLGGTLVLADIPPLLGSQTSVGRITLSAEDCTNGATYLHLLSNHNLLNQAALAYQTGANGIICSEHIPPMAGGFTITVPNMEIVNGVQYPLISRLIAGRSVLAGTTHRHHLRRSA